MQALQTIGQVESISFSGIGLQGIPARIDTGAKTSAIWASGIIEKQGRLHCVLFGPDSALYSGEVLEFTEYEIRTVLSSIGEAEERYVVKLLVTIAGRTINASFTLANRAAQTYPVLIGRNVLRGKFLVDVSLGNERPPRTAKAAGKHKRKVEQS